MDTSTSVSLEKLSETELINFLARYAFANGYSVALWQLPQSPARHLIIARNFTKLEKKATVIEELPAGFIFAPFDREKESIFLPADFIFRFENGTLKESQDPAEISSATWLNDQLKQSNSLRTVNFEQNTNPPRIADKDDYLKLINQCIAEIERGTFEKIVPSRRKSIDLPENFDPLAAFQKLCNRYPHALVSFVSIPGSGTWLGASPELLVCVEEKTIFKTVALAGTLPFHEGVNPKAVAWTQKEIEEQALVERYVISCFKKIRVREYEEHGPKTVVAGNLMHLKSDFTVDMKAINFPQLGTVMLQLLHPTSAVCGMPLEPSLEFLKKSEHYDRSFYSGFLGPVNVDSNISIYVNLRCMQLWQNMALLYAGAGVTVDSEPEKEYAETEIKFNTLLNVIF